MLRYLSPSGSTPCPPVAADEGLRSLAETVSIGLTQAVTDGPEGDVIYHLQIGDGTAAFGAGPAYPEDVRFEQSWETAVGVATGTLNAEQAFTTGQILLTGDSQKLVEAIPVFQQLDAVFGEIGAEVEYA
ncbi:MAG: hypothetical protein R2715_20355 [Ilumatobacteraceae bacterium]